MNQREHLHQNLVVCLLCTMLVLMKMIKKEILAAFQRTDGTCRILFSTIAFGMGVDIPGVRTIIHYGSCSDIESYFQESGHAGRDGKESIALLYMYQGSLLGHVEKNMKAYCTLEEGKCHREQLLKHFPGESAHEQISPPHACCVIYALKSVNVERSKNMHS